jgi:hypothetical protein
MHHRTCIALLGGLLVACAHPAKSQADSSFDSLTIPVSPMTCREVSLAAADSAAFAFEFVDSRGSIERQSFFAFDSTGSPVYATTQTTRVLGPTGGGWAELSAIRFSPKLWGTRARKEFAPGQPPADSANVAPVPAALLSAEDLARGRVLADWIWKHRCGARG